MPNVIQLLDGVSADMAKHRPLLKRHNIWEILNNLNYWMQDVLKELKIGSPIIGEKEDWSSIGVTEEKWHTSIKDLEKTVNTLLNALTKFPELKFEEKVPSKNYTYRNLLQGILNHNLYHMGQIAVLR